MLMAEHDVTNSGIDFQSFIYYDFALRFFNLNGKPKERAWHCNLSEFIETLNNPLFSSHLMAELQMMPMTNYTKHSYQMYTYQKINNFNSESDFLTKFVETGSKKLESKANSNLKGKLSLKTKSRQPPVVPIADILHMATNVTFSINITAKRMFEVMDVNSDGYIDWYDYGYWYSTLFLFNRFDPYNKGRLTAGDLAEKFADYSGFPKVCYQIRDRAHRFEEINADTYLDFFNAHSVLRVDDIIALYIRRTDPVALYEVELKRVFKKLQLSDVGEGRLNRCLRNLDNNKIPRYDWECAFMMAIQENINYINSASDYLTVNTHNLTLSNTVFYNVDPALTLPNAGPVPARFF